MDGTYALGVVLTILGGVAMAMQSGVNATLGSSTGNKPFASVVSFGVGTCICLLYLLIDATALKNQLPSAASISAAPWWAWIGGALGAYYVVVVIIFAQKLGAGTLVAIFVCAQLITSVVLDLTGIVGFPRRVFSWQRWVGAALMVAGVVLVSRFPGETVEAVQQRQAKEVAMAADALSAGIVDSSSTSQGSGRRLLMLLHNIGYDNSATAADAGVDATARVLASAVDAGAVSDQADMLVRLQDKV